LGVLASAVTATAVLVAHRVFGSFAAVVSAVALVFLSAGIALLLESRSEPPPADEVSDPIQGIEFSRPRAMARLSLGIAHDLRASINGIILNLANLRRSMADFDQTSFCPDKQVVTIDMLEEELRRLQRAVESLISQTTPVATAATTFSIREVLEELEFFLQAQARQQRIDLEIPQPAALPPVTAPRDWIKQAILNLVVNAFDATPEGGRVAIDTNDLDGEAVEIVVSDTGSGIPRALTSDIFNLRVSGKSGGTGIGLYTARRAVESSGGTLNLLRTGPGGTSFVIRMPAARGASGGQPA
jgi:signal transduction histidine kinase